ncbi:unnamed protein product [Rotaria sp. Silwood2]|nr:unnamed protein product [Rotaria sp. Silwood2]CAF4078164.1 unnamed protein product [Rotaria sp. Silwood2]
MIKPLIKWNLVSKQLSYKPCAVIIGKTGTGKTTLANKLCETNHRSGVARGSVTQELYRNGACCGQYPFYLIDTPGTDSSTEPYKHAILLKEGLTATKLNTIFLVIKYDNRFDKITENYFQVELPISKYAHKIVVMISHWDQSKTPQNDFKTICELFAEECPNVVNLIFFSEQSSNSEVANLMYSCISNMNEEELKITDEEFALNFNIYEMKSQMKVSFKQYQNRINLLVQDYTKLINSMESESVEDKDEVYHMIIVKFKEEIDTLLQQFQQQHGSAMQELDYYAFYIKMQKENVKICDEFVRKVVPLMSFNLFDNDDPRNLIKRCPNCHLIWYKTEGCDGITNCGNNDFNNYFDINKKPFWKYIVERVNGRLQWKKNKMEKPIPEKPAQSNSKRVGCGIEFVWGEQPKIEEEKILELFKVKTFEEAKELIKSAKFEQLRQNYEQNINREFHC